MSQYVVANWKMNLGGADGVEFARTLSKALPARGGCQVLVAPPFTSLAAIVKEFGNSRVQVGGQNVHWDSTGAFTGEISPAFLKQLGANFAITGHSERRHQFGETNELVKKRTLGSLDAGLITILCVGETREERQANRTDEVLEEQLADIALEASRFGSKFLVAYEPVWAIGTGIVAAPDDIQHAHTLIREIAGAPDLAVLYGGSVSPGNFTGIAKLPEVSGALVGGASLKVDQFLQLVEIAGG